MCVCVSGGLHQQVNTRLGGITPILGQSPILGHANTRRGIAYTRGGVPIRQCAWKHRVRESPILGHANTRGASHPRRPILGGIKPPQVNTKNDDFFKWGYKNTARQYKLT